MEGRSTWAGSLRALNVEQRNSGLTVSSLGNSQRGSWGHSKNCGSVFGCLGMGTGWHFKRLQVPGWSINDHPDCNPHSTPPAAYVSDKTLEPKIKFYFRSIQKNSMFCTADTHSMFQTTQESF